MTARLVLGLLSAAARWHLAMAPTRLSYWIRPYDSHLDARCWRWRRPPCPVVTLTCDTSRFDEAMAAAVASTEQMGARRG